MVSNRIQELLLVSPPLTVFLPIHTLKRYHHQCTISRPITWRKQTSDVVVDGFEIGKDRALLEAGIRPNSRIINNVSAAATEVFVDTAVPLFGEIDDLGETLQSVLILDPTEKTGAAATAIVSAAGTITSFVISDGGSGYTSAPAFLLV